MQNSGKLKQNKYYIYALAGCFIMVFIAEMFFMRAVWTCDAGDVTVKRPNHSFQGITGSSEVSSL